MSEQSGLPITLPDPQASELDTTFLPATQTPAQLLALAISKDLDIEKLERLMELQERWEAKQAKSAFFEALTEFQSICPELKKTKKVSYQTSKGTTEYWYATLPSIISQIKSSLKQCGLSFRWEQEELDNLIKITCIVTHVNGHSERTYLPGGIDDTGSKNPIQARGSTVTYLQRYTLISALGLSSADTDNDGNPPVPTITKDQAANLAALLDELGERVNKEGFLKFLKIGKLEDLPIFKYDRAVKELEGKRKC